MKRPLLLVLGLAAIGIGYLTLPHASDTLKRMGLIYEPPATLQAGRISLAKAPAPLSQQCLQQKAYVENIGDTIRQAKDYLRDKEIKLRQARTIIDKATVYASMMSHNDKRSFYGFLQAYHHEVTTTDQVISAYNHRVERFNHEIDVYNSHCGDWMSPGETIAKTTKKPTLRQAMSTVSIH